MHARIARPLVFLALLAWAFVAGPALRPLAAEDAWVPTGPPGGLAQALVIHPRTPRILWAGTDNAGIFKSVDGGFSWAPSSQGLGINLQILALAVAPSDPETLYAAVAPARDNFGSFGGIFRTSDGGRTWRAMLSCPPNPLSGIGCARLGQTFELDVHPKNPRIVYAATGRGVFKSTNGGVRWDPTGRFGFAFYTYALAIDPERPQVLYAGGGDGVSRSADGGATWAPWNEGMGREEITEIVIDPSNPRRIWAGGGGFASSVVFRSTDGGAHWQGARSGLPEDRGVSALAVSPAAGRGLPVVWAGNPLGVFRSLDGGATWTESPDLHGLYVGALVTHPAQPRVLWAAVPLSFRTDRVTGIYRTRDGGAAWRLASRGLYGLPMTSLAFDPRVPGVFWASSSTEGVFRCGDGGVTWAQRNGNLPAYVEVYAVEVDPVHPGTVWIGTSHGVYVTEDSGTTWEARNEGLGPGSPHTYLVPVLRVSATDPSVAYAASFQDLHRTLDGGEHWTRIEIPVSLPSTQWRIGDVLIDPRDPDVVFVAAEELWVTRDGGDTWQQVQPGSVSFVSALAADPRDPDILYAAGLGLYRSTDGGQTWQGQTGAPVLDATEVAVGPTGEVWMSDSVTVFRSPDGVSGWTRAPDLHGLLIQDLGIDPFLERVLAETSAGLFRFLKD